MTEFKSEDMEVISGKRKDRLIAMTTEAKDVGTKMVMYCGNAVQNIQVADNLQERVMQAMGMMEAKRIGITICKDCLDRTISLIEEHMGILKDIRDSVK